MSDDKQPDPLMDFLLNWTFNEEVIAMDCRDCCEQLSDLAERVAAGERLCDLMPQLEEHMDHWKDCREEFEALVAILKAEQEGRLPQLPRKE